MTSRVRRNSCPEVERLCDGRAFGRLSCNSMCDTHFFQASDKVELGLEDPVIALTTKLALTITISAPTSIYPAA